MTSVWYGIGKRGILRNDLEQQRDALADAAKACDWPTVIALVRALPELANTVRPDDESGFAPLHEVAHGGAPSSVAMSLIACGAWRTLRSSGSDRPIDIARARGHHHLESVLQPVLLQWIPTETLALIERHFHSVIRDRIGDLEQENALRMPQLSPMLETFGDWWFPVPGMYGGFAYRWKREGADALLVCDSWCRVVSGSEEQHEISVHGSTLIPQKPRPSGIRIIKKAGAVPEISGGD